MANSQAPDQYLIDHSGSNFHFSMDSTITGLAESIKAGEASLSEAMKKLQASKNPDPASLASMQFRINKWTLNFNLFSSMIKSVKDVATATIQKI